MDPPTPKGSVQALANEGSVQALANEGSVRALAGRSSPRRMLAVGGLLVAAVLAAAAHGPTRTVHAPTTTSTTVPAPLLQWDRWISIPGVPPLSGASSAFDADDDDLIVFGGRTANGTVSDDTWVWNGKVWTRIPASQTIAPPARHDASIAFDPYLHQLILFGGESSSGGLLGDTWAWNGYSWYQLGGAGPGPREAAALSFDPQGNLVLFGGFGYPYPAGYSPGHGPATSVSKPAAPAVTAPAGAPAASAEALADTWVWTSAGWASTDAQGPSARAASGVALDPLHRTTVLFGGIAGAPDSGTHLLSDTWTWNGSAWSRSRARPPAIAGTPLLVDDSQISSVLMLGAGRSDTTSTSLWRWTGSSWETTTAKSAPPWRSGEVAVYDSSSATLVLGGEVIAGATPSGGFWQLVATPAQPAASGGGGGGGGSVATLPPVPTTTPASSTSRSRHHPLAVGPLHGPSHGDWASWQVTAAMLGIALAIPVVAWLGIAGVGRARRAPSSGRGGGP
jgi:hypothetical protein